MNRLFPAGHPSRRSTLRSAAGSLLALGSSSLAPFASLAPLAPASFAAPPIDLAKAGMDAAALQRIVPRMKQFQDQGRLAGTVTLLLRHGALAHFEATGWADIEAKKPMKPDTIFQVMSMTKPLVGVAVMMQVEAGLLSLSDPVEKHLPEFRGQMVLAAKNPDGSLVLRKPSRPITVHDCMTHLSGLPYGPVPGFAELNQNMDKSLAEAVLLYSQQPLLFDPGTKWSYSNIGIAVLGRLLEVTSGQSFEQFLESRLFLPLAMKDSHFFLPAAKRERLAAVYRFSPAGLQKAGSDILGGDPLRFRPGAKYPAPEWGLYTTAEDLSHFYQMMLQGGQWNGKRLLSRFGVQMMTRKHTADVLSGHSAFAAFGLTWEVIDDQRGELHYLSQGSFGHGGAFSTHGWVDPRKDLVGVYLTQMIGVPAEAKYAFMQIAGAAVVD